MPLAANTATVQILDDNATHVVAKFQFFQHTANAGSHEASVVKINANALVCRTQELTFTDVPQYLWPTDVATQGNNAAITGRVASWKGNTVTVVLMNSAAAFQNSATVTFSRPAGNLTTHTLTATGANKTLPELALRQASWSISGNSATRVALEWAGNPNTEIIAFSSGSGYIGKNNLATTIPSDVTNPTGDVNITTYGTPALTGYSIIAEFAKVKGYGPQGQ